MSEGWNVPFDDDPRRRPSAPLLPSGEPAWKGMELGLPDDGPGSLGRFWRRFAGCAIDALLFIPLLLIETALRHPHLVDQVSPSGAHRQHMVESHLSVPTALLVLVPGAVYVIAMIAWRGQTLGQQAMGLRTIRLADRQTPGLTPALARWIVVAAAGIIGVFIPALAGWLGLWTLLVYLWAAWDRDRQGLHDKFARVIVIRTG